MAEGRVGVRLRGQKFYFKVQQFQRDQGQCWRVLSLVNRTWQLLSLEGSENRMRRPELGCLFTEWSAGEFWECIGGGTLRRKGSCWEDLASCVLEKKGSGIRESMKPVCGEGRVSEGSWRKRSLTKLEEIKLSRSCCQEPMRVYTFWMMVQPAKQGSVQGRQSELVTFLMLWQKCPTEPA